MSPEEVPEGMLAVAASVGPLAYTQAMTTPQVPHVWRHVAATMLAAALTEANRPAVASDAEVAEDITTQYRDGQVYSFNHPPEG